MLLGHLGIYPVQVFDTEERLFIPDHIRASKSLESFKSDIENWKPEGCKCRLCKEYIPNLGYI